MVTVGETFTVNQKVIDEETGIDFFGWRGIVRSVFEVNSPEASEPDQALIEWDFSEPNEKQLEYIRSLFESQLEWSTCVLPINVLSKSAEPVSILKLEWVKNRLGELYFWDSYPDYRRTIRQVFENVMQPAEKAPFSFWEEALRRSLRFPFSAQVIFPYAEDEGDLQENDLVDVMDLMGWDYPLGMFAEVRRGQKNYVLPLQDLEPVKPGKNRKYLDTYQIWLECRA